MSGFGVMPSLVYRQLRLTCLLSSVFWQVRPLIMIPNKVCVSVCVFVCVCVCVCVPELNAEPAAFGLGCMFTAEGFTQHVRGV